jgi:hypothetical protein
MGVVAVWRMWRRAALVGVVRTRGSGGGELLMESVGRRGECMLVFVFLPNKLIRQNGIRLLASYLNLLTSAN